MNNIYLKELQLQDHLIEQAPSITPGTASPSSLPSLTPPPEASTPTASSTPPAPPTAPTTPKPGTPKPGGNIQQKLKDVINKYFGVTLPDETAVYITKDPKNRLLKFMTAVDPDLGFTYDPKAIKLQARDIVAAPGTHPQSTIVNQVSTVEAAYTSIHQPLILEAATVETIQTFLRNIRAPAATPERAQEAAKNWNNFIEDVKSDNGLGWNYDIRTNDSSEGGGNVPPDDKPCDPALVRALLQPSLEFDGDKRYYLNIAGPGMKRSFNWKELKNQDLRVTFKNTKNILKAEQNIQNYITQLQQTLQGSETPAGTGNVQVNASIEYFTNKFYDLYRMVTEQAGAPLPAEVDLGGSVGSVSTGIIFNDILEKSAGASAIAHTTGFGPDDVLGKVMFTDQVFKSAQREIPRYLQEYYSRPENTNRFTIPLIGIATLNPRSTPPGEYTIQPIDPSIGLTAIDQQSAAAIRGVISNYISTQAQNVQTRMELQHALTQSINDYIGELGNIDPPVPNLDTDQLTRALATPGVSNHFSATIMGIVDDMVKSANIIKIDTTAMQNMHNFIHQYFCVDPNQYLLYLTEDQWNDIVMGGNVMGSMLGILSSISKNF